jgi:hypothetical protein
MSIWEFLMYAVLLLVGGFILFFILIIALFSMGLRNKFLSPVQFVPLTERIFDRVVKILMGYARALKISYYAVNILLYYFIVPFSWLILLDMIFDFHYFKIGFALFCLGFFIYCKDFEAFSLNLYRRSVVFLNYFNHFGSNYVASSVFICVLCPILVYGGLIYLLVI